MKSISTISMIFIFVMALVTIQFLSSDAQATSGRYDSNCGICHTGYGATQPTCMGCHPISGFNGQTNKASYEPGETVTVNITGSGRTSTSWARFIIYDQSGNPVATTSGNNSGIGSSSTLPTSLSAPAPTIPGNYTWKAAWFSNTTSSMGTHGEQGRVNTNSFTVVAPAPVTHFPAPTETLLTATFSGSALVDNNILGQTSVAVAGDEIGVFDSTGVLCGRYIVTNNGQFGPLVVYGDDPATSGIDEGATNGEALIFILWDSQREMELAVRTLQPNGDRQTVTWADNGGGTMNLQGLALDRIGVVKNGNWKLDANDNGISDSADLDYIYGGSAADTPIMGDWNGDGIATPGVKRGNTYYLRNSNSQGVADVSFRYGDPNDVPVVGDWDGDGVDTIGIKRGNFFYLRNSNSPGMANITLQFGLASDAAVVGDWNGDGVDTIGVYRSSDGNFYLRNSLTSGMANSVFSFNILDGKPLAGKW